MTKNRVVVLCILILWPAWHGASNTDPAVEAQQHRSRGNYHFYRKAYPEAIVQYQQALRVKADDHMSHYMLGRIYTSNGIYHLAQMYFLQILKHRNTLSSTQYPLILQTYLELAHCFYVQSLQVPADRYMNPYLSEMERYLTAVLDAFTHDPLFKKLQTDEYAINRHYFLYKAHFILGRYYAEQGRGEDYSTHFKKSLESLKRLLPPFSNKGIYRSMNDEHQRMIERKAIALYFCWHYYAFMRPDQRAAAVYRNELLSIQSTAEAAAAFFSSSDLQFNSPSNAAKYREIAAYIASILKDGFKTQSFRFLQPRIFNPEAMLR
jgi:tetratricopeptide (TPR) repeat protein